MKDNDIKEADYFSDQWKQIKAYIDAATAEINAFTDPAEAEAYDSFKNDIKDLLIVTDLKIKHGFEKTTYLYANDVDLKNYEHVSNTRKKIELEYKSFPLFFVYVLPKDAQNIKKDLFKKISISIGNTLAEEFIEKIKNFLNDKIKF